MRELLTSLDWTRLGFYKSVLDEAGIASFIRNEHTAQLVNVLIAPCQPSLCVVNDDDYDAAMALLRPHHHSTPPSIEEWTCRGCGEVNPAEFELCWQCQKPREETGS
jgi:hypothetical protein